MSPEYLDFHLTTLLLISQQLDSPLVISRRTGEIFPINHIDPAYKTQALQSIESISSFKQALQAQGCIINASFTDFMQAYLQQVVSAPKDLRQEFYEHFNLCRISLSTLNQVLPEFEDEDIKTIFTNRNKHLAMFDSGFETTLELLKPVVGHHAIITQYIKEKIDYIKDEKAWITMRNALVRQFPGELHHFKDIQAISYYLYAQKQETDIFFEPAEESILYLKVDLAITRDRYPIGNFGIDNYSHLFQALVSSLEDQQDFFGISKINCRDIFVYKNNYHCTDLYIHLQRQSTLNKNQLQTLVRNFFRDYHCTTMAHQQYTHKWLKQYILETILPKTAQEVKTLKKV